MRESEPEVGRGRGGGCPAEELPADVMPAGEETAKAKLGEPVNGKVLQTGGSPVATGPILGGGRCPAASDGSCSMEADIPSGTLCGGKEKFKIKMLKIPVTGKLSPRRKNSEIAGA